MNMARLVRHLLLPDAWLQRKFSRATLQAIARAITESERSHGGELRFAVEATLPTVALLRGQSARERALEVFSDLRVWDTEHNSGVLVYVQLADQRVEIVADRGINARVTQDAWEAICRKLETEYRNGGFERGSLAAIAEITALLQRHFPATGVNPDELPNRPAVLD
jgi:uncharacterized membrane protein